MLLESATVYRYNRTNGKHMAAQSQRLISGRIECQKDL